MFKIKIYDIDLAKIKMKTDGPTRIVSLLDKKSAIEHQGDHHLIVEISDISHDITYFPATLLNANEPIVPDTKHLLAVLEHTKNLSDSDNVIVHCFAGQSRSPAMAIAICINNGMFWKDAFDYIESIRPVMMPNQKIISLIDRYFKLNGELINYHYEWLLKTMSRTE